MGLRPNPTHNIYYVLSEVISRTLFPVVFSIQSISCIPLAV